VGLVELGISALVVLWRRRRLAVIGEIAARLSQLRDDKEGIVRAELTTAVPMPDSYYQMLSDRIAQATNKRVVLEHHVDPELIAGAVAKVGDSVLDASVLGRLTKFKQQVLGALASGTA
jgi:F-type H+-transporting ATPase subunit delta